jgi:hypothetical protein
MAEVSFSSGQPHPNWNHQTDHWDFGARNKEETP